MIDRFERFSFDIFQISRFWHKLATEEMSKYGLKGSYATCLTTMYRYNEGITSTKLCELCSKDKADISRMISIMQNKGLIKREGNNQNFYRGLLKLTEEGKAISEQVQKRARLAVEMAGKDLTDESRTIFYQALDSITYNLRKITKEGLPQI